MDLRFAFVEFKDYLHDENSNDYITADYQKLLTLAIYFNHAVYSLSQARQLEVGEVILHGVIAQCAHVIEKQKDAVVEIAGIKVVGHRVEY